MNVVVRPARPEDAPALHQILQGSFGEYQSLLKLSEPPAALRETEDDILRAMEEQTMLLAVYNRLKSVGSIRVRRVNNDVAYISRFAVLPNWQSSGAGSALMTEAVSLCREQGVRAIALHTAVKMIPLARFYHGCGFYIHSVEAMPGGYRRGLFIKELEPCDDLNFDTMVLG